jgi:hypothetical protein
MAVYPPKLAPAITIDVTQQDIDHSDCGDPANCAIAKAFYRATGYYAEVGDGLIKVPGIDEPENLCRYEYPEEVQGFIDRFDAYDLEHCAPFAFEAVRL